MFLVTYRCESKNRVIWGYEITDDPAMWLVETQEYDDGPYFIVNVLPVSKKWAEENKGALKGM